MNYKRVYCGDARDVSPCGYRGSLPYVEGRNVCTNGECPGEINSECPFRTGDTIAPKFERYFKFADTSVVALYSASKSGRDAIVAVIEVESKDVEEIQVVWDKYVKERTESENLRDCTVDEYCELAESVDRIGDVPSFAIWAYHHGYNVRLITIDRCIRAYE